VRSGAEDTQRPGREDRCTQGITNFCGILFAKRPSLKPEQAITQKYSVWLYASSGIHPNGDFKRTTTMKYLLGIALGLLLSASVAKADGLYPGENVFDLSGFFTIAGYPTSYVRYSVTVLEVDPTAVGYQGYCQGPILPATGNAYPYCPTDEPWDFSIPKNVPYDFGTLTWLESYYLGGFWNPGPAVSTPEPSTGGLLVAGCFLCGFVALRRRMA
jgi:hypothetical protein